MCGEVMKLSRVHFHLLNKNLNPWREGSILVLGEHSRRSHKSRVKSMKRRSGRKALIGSLHFLSPSQMFAEIVSHMSTIVVVAKERRTVRRRKTTHTSKRPVAVQLLVVTILGSMAGQLTSGDRAVDSSLCPSSHVARTYRTTGSDRATAIASIHSLDLIRSAKGSGASAKVDLAEALESCTYHRTPLSLTQLVWVAHLRGAKRNTPPFHTFALEPATLQIWCSCSHASAAARRS